MENKEIRKKIWEASLRHYKIAEKIGVSHITIMNWMRVKLTPEREAKILKAIEELSKDD